MSNTGQWSAHRASGGEGLSDCRQEILGLAGLVEDGKRAKMSLKKGDIVLFGKYSGTEVKIDGEEYTIMREGDVLAVVD